MRLGFLLLCSFTQGLLACSGSNPEALDTSNTTPGEGEPQPTSEMPSGSMRELDSGAATGPATGPATAQPTSPTGVDSDAGADAQAEFNLPVDPGEAQPNASLRPPTQAAPSSAATDPRGREHNPCDADSVIDAELDAEQCLRRCQFAEPLVLDSADAVAALAQQECVIVEGSLQVTGAEIDDLAGLENIRKVTGAVQVMQTSKLENLRGLAGLEITGLNLISNTGLSNVSGLDALRIVRGGLLLSGNSLIQDLSELEGVVFERGSLTFSGNEGLLTLDGLDGVAAVDDVLIAGNPKLTTVNSLQRLAESKNLTITQNEVLDSVVFPALGVAEAIAIASNASLRSIELSSLTDVSNLTIQDNARLQSLDISSAQGVGEFVLVQNPLLSDLGDLSSLETITSLSLSDNETLSRCIMLELTQRAEECSGCEASADAGACK